MTDRSVDLGAPATGGMSANELVAEVFGEATYPLTVAVKNHIPADVAFREVRGLSLRHVANPAESEKTVVIDSLEQFQRLASKVQQIAVLGGHVLALTIAEVAASTDESGSDTDRGRGHGDASDPSSGSGPSTEADKPAAEGEGQAAPGGSATGDGAKPGLLDKLIGAVKST